MLEPSPLVAANGYTNTSDDVGESGRNDAAATQESSCPTQNSNTTNPTNHNTPKQQQDRPSSESVENGKISDSVDTPNQSIDIAGIVNDDDENEPLGYQNFLCDVNIEYSPGGHLSSSDSNQHCFKMKYLPYMVNRNSFNRSIDENSSNHSLSDGGSVRDEDSMPSEARIKPIDVAKTTCAFLGNSEYVPNQKFNRRRVVLEMISAKLSQSTTFNVSVTSNHHQANLQPRTERRLSISRNGLRTRDTDNGSRMSSCPDSSLYESPNTNHLGNNQHNSSPMTSKKFVNYTILIKTAPGLDSHPAVIERRFSDFLQLYQGLKQQSNLGSSIDKHVAFPRKVYMGNFSVANIAERSIVFAKLLDLCMTNIDILWSGPFISFLLDKELSEAHKLSLCGDPEDVQALIETAYFIEKKIYFNWLSSSKFSTNSTRTSPNLSESNSPNDDCRNSYSPSLPRNGIAIQSSSSEETISAGSSIRSNNLTNRSPASTAPRSSPLQSISDCGEDTGNEVSGKMSSALSQRVLVTFCILILTYHRGENYSDLRLAVLDFSQLVSSQRFVESMAQTRHFATLRACLLFLMNINRGNVIDDNQRLWLKRILEDIDGTYASANGGFNDMISNNRQRGNTEDTSNVCRVTKGDLTSMLRDRNFCSFKSDLR